MKWIKGLNDKTKCEQLFIIFSVCLFCFGLLCITGCGKKKCEGIRCGRVDEDYLEGGGCSIPGCGGLCGPGKGCNTCLWAQSEKFINGKRNTNNPDDKANVTGCDITYYGGGCLGCGQAQKHSYFGCTSASFEGDKAAGFFFGGSEEDEKMVACLNGCGGCIKSGGIGSDMIREFEQEMGWE